MSLLLTKREGTNAGNHRKTHCFSNLNEAILLVLAKAFKSKTFEAGKRFYTEGNIGDRLFIIESGYVAVLKNIENGSPVEVAALHPGDIAGEMGLFGNKVRTATLQACNECKVWELGYDTFEDLLEQYGSIANRLLSYVCRHLVRETSIVAKLLARNIEPGLRIAFFHSTPYRNTLYRQRNQYNYAMHFCFCQWYSQDTILSSSW